ncbi:sensor histidine kinase [Cohnella candidum]|uniref:histidine kinase n=1 Tax=Cohnella candidum TaxID=2674991 RepID=A0A3G3JXF9_9BACL|nr:HAMP domain-containing sensor histidine kinase [Cohnella candidum]AYQ72541.1 sensor histidine kinase [Cohnella candidum]
MRMNSLRSQLLIRSLLLLLAILVGVGVVQYLFMERFLYRNKADAIRRQILSVPGDVWQRFSEGMRRGREFPVFILSSSSVVYRDPDGNLTEIGPDADEDAAPKLNEELLKETLASPERERGRISYRISKNERGVEQLVVMQAVRSFGGMSGIVQVSTNTGPIKADAYRQLALYSGIAVLALMLGWLLFRPVIKRTLIPLHRVTRTLERIDAGSLGERLPSKQGQAEIDLLAASTNRMLERLEQSFRSEQEGKERMRRFVADASHELRTPLTSIHGFLEILLRGAASHPEQLEQALRSMHGESKRMGKLVQDLLLLAKLDRNPELHPDVTDLNGILREMEPHLRLLAEDRQVIFELRTLPPAKLDSDKIKQVLLNLFQNAVQHTDPARGEIRVSTEIAAGGIAWSVGDNGSGIPAGHLPRLFDRFYRVDESRARAYGGTGLGLSISKAIVEWHGGTLTARSEPGRGSRFTVLLPVEEPGV